MSCVTCRIFFGQSGEAYQLRVSYQWGLPRLFVISVWTLAAFVERWITKEYCSKGLPYNPKLAIKLLPPISVLAFYADSETVLLF